MRAAANLGGKPIRNFFKIQAPLIAPGVISGALFAFITSFDEIVIVLFVGGPLNSTPCQDRCGLVFEMKLVQQYLLLQQFL